MASNSEKTGRPADTQDECEELRREAWDVDPHVAAPQSSESHDDEKPSGSSGP